MFVKVQIPVNLYGAFVHALKSEPGCATPALAAEAALAAGIRILDQNNNVVLLEQRIRHQAKKQHVSSNPRSIRTNEATTAELTRLGNLHGIAGRNRIATECICQYLYSQGIITVEGNQILFKQPVNLDG